MVPRDLWLCEVTDTSDKKIAGFLKQHFIAVSSVWVDEHSDFNATFVLLNNLFFFWRGDLKNRQVLKRANAEA